MSDVASPIDIFWQLTLMGLEVTIISCLLLGMFRIRRVFGLSMLYLALGVFQQMQVMLAVSVYVELAPGLMISPGSAVLFTASLFAALLVYIKEGALEARRLVYGLMVANLVLSLLTVMFGIHLDSPLTQNVLGLPREIFVVNPRVLAIGTLVLFVDVLVLIVSYEALSRLFPRALYARILLTMAVVACVDSVLFSVGVFLGQDRLMEMITANLLGKLSASVLFAVFFTLYLRVFDQEEATPGASVSGLGVFQLFTYRERYEKLAAKAARDALTGAFNRGFFDQSLPEFLSRSEQSGRSMVLVLLDLDHFKSVNDRWGHRVGDEVLRKTTQLLASMIRDEDLLCRIGGEEFALLLPAITLDDAADVVDRMRASLRENSTAASWLGDGVAVSFTAGLALFPDDATTGNDLMDLADQRLYAGKAGGRDRSVSSGLLARAKPGASGRP